MALDYDLTTSTESDIEIVGDWFLKEWGLTEAAKLDAECFSLTPGRLYKCCAIGAIVTVSGSYPLDVEISRERFGIVPATSIGFRISKFDLYEAGMDRMYESVFSYLIDDPGDAICRNNDVTLFVRKDGIMRLNRSVEDWDHKYGRIQMVPFDYEWSDWEP